MFLSYLENNNDSHSFQIHKSLEDKKVVLLVVPVAFTPPAGEFLKNLTEEVASLDRPAWQTITGGTAPVCSKTSTISLGF